MLALGARTTDLASHTTSWIFFDTVYSPSLPRRICARLRADGGMINTAHKPKELQKRMSMDMQI